MSSSLEISVPKLPPRFVKFPIYTEVGDISDIIDSLLILKGVLTRSILFIDAKRGTVSDVERAFDEANELVS